MKSQKKKLKKLEEEISMLNKRMTKTLKKSKNTRAETSKTLTVNYRLSEGFSGKKYRNTMKSYRSSIANSKQKLKKIKRQIKKYNRSILIQ